MRRLSEYTEYDPEPLWSDSTIIDYFFLRDETAIRQADRRYGRDLYRLSYRILADHQDSEENLDDTWLSAWNSIPPVRPLSLAVYLLKLCRNHALDRLDYRKARKRHAEVVKLTKEMEECLPGSDVESSIVANELAATVSVFLKKLPPDQRYIMIARCFEMEPFSEIAKDLGIREANVRVTLSRLRARLKQYLETYYL